MKNTKLLRLEIKRLNSKLDQISHQSRFMVYNANPWKFALYNFIAGIFHSLGSLVGTAVIAAAIVYFLREINLAEIIMNFFNQILEQNAAFFRP